MMDKPSMTERWKQACDGCGREVRQVMDELFEKIGWFDDAAQSEPTYDPMMDAALGCRCILCGVAVCLPMKTVSLKAVEQPKRSYFYRVHAACYQGNEATADQAALALIHGMEAAEGPKS